MNNKATKPIVLTVVFLISAFVFSMLTNKVNIDSTTTMDEASLPVMHFVYEDKIINELHGYMQEMDMLSMRDGMVPIGEDRAIHLEVMTYGNEVENLSYKIRSMDSERLLMEEDCADITVTQDKVGCNISLPSLFEDNQEYNMEIVLTVGEKEIYYYTRMVRSLDCYIDESLDFAMLFHEYTFRDDAKDFIPTYMDPATGDATTLSYVDLSCTLRQITWADFTGVKLTEPVASFKEVNNSYNVITLNYVMTNVNEQNEVEYYNVEEYYRLRYTPTRIYVLNFERRMNQIFRNENNFFLGTTGILLGIRDNDVEYLANDSGNCIAFVQEGELWCYDRVNNTISQVFSFRGAEGINSRENWDQHDIQIIRIDEAGSISFVVSGYMNRGEHEGYVGVAVYHYDGIGHTVEEEVFIPSNKSFEMLQAELGELLFVNEQKMLYLMLDNDVYKIDMNTFDISLLVNSETDDSYAISESGRYFAWVESKEKYSSTTIHLEDLKMGITYEVNAEKDCYLLPIAFVGEDFVYGVTQATDVKTNALGEVLYPMSKLEILNTSEEKRDVIKTYSPDGNKIGKVTVDEANIYVELVAEVDGKLVVRGTDTIMNREAEPANGVKLRKSVTDLKQTQIAINMKEIKKDTAVQSILPKHILLEESRNVDLNVKMEGYYYAYARGKVLLATKDVGEAVRCANENYGVVVDSELRYIFKRARSTSQTAFQNLVLNEADVAATPLMKAVSIILTREDVGISVSDLAITGQTPIQILESTLKGYAVLELEDCTVDELLYFIDLETPVLARTGVDRAILLTGYTSSTVTYYDPATRQNKTVSYEEVTRLFENGGNYFIAYVK
ncbi:MAG: hypothetical protein IJE49_02215 [Agathobacter sp.]|nr:hypothetical protein [Agathobacter sp.]